MTYSFIERKKRKRRRRALVSFLLFIFLGISLFLFISRLTNQKPPQEPQNLSLKNAIENALNEAEGTYALAIKNLKTQESYYSKENNIFEAGSLYKLWVMTEAFGQIENGSLKKDEELSASISDLNREFNIASDEAELASGGINLTVSSAINQMITISHNYAALLLTKRIKLSQVADFLKKNGLNDSQVGTNGNPPKTTAANILLFYEKLYKGELANPENTQEMLNVLKKQQLNDGLPKYMSNIPIAHKTGDIGWFKHDAGIIFTEKGDYIIVVLSESDSPLGAQERIAKISKSVFDYFTK